MTYTLEYKIINISDLICTNREEIIIEILADHPTWHDNDAIEWVDEAIQNLQTIITI